MFFPILVLVLVFKLHKRGSGCYKIALVLFPSLKNMRKNLFINEIQTSPKTFKMYTVTYKVIDYMFKIKCVIKDMINCRSKTWFYYKYISGMANTHCHTWFLW